MHTTTYIFLRLLGNEDGAAAVEYALLIGLIALALFGAVVSFGQAVMGLFEVSVFSN